uniref:Secreted protein n=1 Tax=Bursaphelenchus xylophilus TaxID=6326 RepID=A0A1I7SF41_BURXY
MEEEDECAVVFILLAYPAALPFFVCAARKAGSEDFCPEKGREKVSTRGVKYFSHGKKAAIEMNTEITVGLGSQ